MRFHVRTSENTGVSVGIVGAFVLGVLLATVWFYLALFVAAVLVVYGLYAGGRWLLRR
jgi:hypothetical protein